MKYIRTKYGHIFEIVDYEQLDENTKKNVRQPRYVGLEDYLNEKIFVKIYKNMPNPISQYQSIKMFDILKQADTIEELCDELVIKYKNEEKPRCVNMTELLKTCKNIGVAFREHTEWLFDNYKDQLEICNLAIWTDKGLIYVAKMNEKGELELL